MESAWPLSKIGNEMDNFCCLSKSTAINDGATGTQIIATRTEDVTERSGTINCSVEHIANSLKERNELLKQFEI